MKKFVFSIILTTISFSNFLSFADEHNHDHSNNPYVVPMDTQKNNANQPMRYPNDTNHSFNMEQAIDIANKNKDEIFSECILKSGKMIDVLDALRTIPENKRVVTLVESGYWESLNEEEQTNTLKTLANFEGVSGDEYDIIKGQISESFKNECVDVIKNIKSK